ncbi:transketolase [Simkania sp.]|uniref:transketolase n=1 Tax=Simkania sp. TaxID=34094 RepID=UPI003B523A68
MDEDLKKILEKTANTIRQLSMEAVQKANSGHPGLPLGCAELGAYLYGHVLRHNPKDPNWVNRDRVILSAGHGSMWLYSCLHLAGFDLSLEEIKRFRQLHSKTPGHPEYHETAGVESTTGPLGQGVGNAVGHALGLKILETKYNKADHAIIDAKVFCLAGDGCLMEGVSNEASSFAGHLCLDNLVLIHDDNKITLDGPLEQSSSEDVAERYRGYGFETYVMDGNDLESIDEVMTKIRENQTKPVFISCKTIIGKGSPNKAGSHKAHGSPLGVDEVKATKEALGLPEEEFYIPQQVKTFFENKLPKQEELEANWQKRFDDWAKLHPECAEDFHECSARKIPEDLEHTLNKLDIPNPISGRKASQAVLEALGDKLPFLYGGSADLSGSDCTMMKQFPLISPKNFQGRNIKYGIREFGMATIASGLFQTGMFIPYIGTFFTFSDYMRNAIRLACLSGYHVIYQLTHDSIFLGEDGPTHQPIEHLAALRAMPFLHVVRPADANEVKGAWLSMLHYNAPSVIVLSRQNLPTLEETAVPFKEGVGRGGYILKKEKSKADFTLFATGSEVALAMDVAKSLERQGKDVRVVSMPCFEIFEKQDAAYKESVVGGDLGKRISIEAGVSQGWFRYIGHDGIPICMESFGLSAPIGDLANEFGFTVDAILDRILSGK